MNRSLYRLLIALMMLGGAAGLARAQDAGPLPPPPTYKANRIPSEPHPGPPPIPEQQIIKSFAANEDIAKKVYDQYDFTQTVRVEELVDSGGKFAVSGEVYTRPDGGRFWRVVNPPVSNLKFTSYTLEDVRTILTFPLLFLTTDELPNYDFVYAGEDKLDQLNTYVFQVKPKMLSRKRSFFQGVVYVDDHDLAIVETYGKFVNELEGEGAKLPFKMFETYRENIEEKYWLPTYTSSDDYITQPNGDELHLRLVVRSTDFKLHSDAVTAPAASAPAAATTTGAPPSQNSQPR
jgi:hypothetical protein